MAYLSGCRRYVSTAIPFLVILVFPQFLFANNLYFPQVAIGGGYTTSFVIINTGTAPVSARINFYDQTGVNLAAYGRAINVPVGGSTRFTLPDQGALTSFWGELPAGTATVQGVATFQGRSDTGALVTAAGVLGVGGGNSFLVPVDVTPTSSTGVAIANVNASSAVTVNLRLLGENGSQVASANDVRLSPLKPHAQIADFVTSFFPQLAGTTFAGALVIEAAAAPANSLAATALTLKEGLLSAIPVLPVRASFGAPPVSVTRAYTTDTNNVEQTSFTVGQTVRLVMTRNNTLSTQVNVEARYRATGPSSYILANSVFSSSPTGTGQQNYYLDVPIPQNATAGSYTFEATLTYNGITTSATSTFNVASGSSGGGGGGAPGPSTASVSFYPTFLGGGSIQFQNQNIILGGQFYTFDNLAPGTYEMTGSVGLGLFIMFTSGSGLLGSGGGGVTQGSLRSLAGPMPIVDACQVIYTNTGSSPQPFRLQFTVTTSTSAACP